MKYPELNKVLEECGLKERHAKVFLSLLSLGTASVQKISEKSGIARSTCESILEGLKQKGLVSSFKRKKVKQYSAEDPKHIVHMAEFKVDILKQALPKFLEVYHQRSGTPSVRSYGDVKIASETIFKEILDEADMVYYFGSTQDFFEVIPVKQIDRYITERIKNKIPLKALLQDGDISQQRIKMSQDLLAKIKIFPSEYNCNGIIFMWGNKIALFSLREQISANIIENKELANLLKTSFNLMWDYLPE